MWEGVGVRGGRGAAGADVEAVEGAAYCLALVLTFST